MNTFALFEDADSIAAALEAIEEFSGLGGDKAHAALAAIRGVLKALKAGLATPRATEMNVKQTIAELRAALESNDDAALAALHARFPQ